MFAQQVVGGEEVVRLIDALVGGEGDAEDAASLGILAKGNMTVMDTYQLLYHVQADANALAGEGALVEAGKEICLLLFGDADAGIFNFEEQLSVVLVQLDTQCDTVFLGCVLKGV